MVQTYILLFKEFKITKVDRESNDKADMLSKLAHNSSDLETSVYFKELGAPSINRKEALAIEPKIQPKWMEPFLTYLDTRILPKRKPKLNKSRQKLHDSSQETASFIEEH